MLLDSGEVKDKKKKRTCKKKRKKCEKKLKIMTVASGLVNIHISSRNCLG